MTTTEEETDVRETMCVVSRAEGAPLTTTIAIGPVDIRQAHEAAGCDEGYSDAIFAREAERLHAALTASLPQGTMVELLRLMMRGWVGA